MPTAIYALNATWASATTRNLLAASEQIPLVDMATVEADRLDALGPEKTALLFPIDHTHTSPEGAELAAESVAIALRNANLPLSAYLKTQ